MKKIALIAIAAVLMANVTSCNKKGEGTTALEDTMSTTFAQLAGPGIKMQLQQMKAMGQAPDSVVLDEFMAGFEAAINADTTIHGKSYNSGFQWGSNIANTIANFNEQGINFNKSEFLRAFKEAFNEPVSDADQEKMMQLNTKMQTLMSQIQAEVAKKKQKEYADFMTDAEKNKGFKKDKSGILYRVEKKGNGKCYQNGESVMLKYKGMHINGKAFDESKTEVKFEVDEASLIKGFVAALRLMSPGAKFTIIIPAALAYGDMGNPQGGIAPGEALVFEIESGKVATAEKADKTPTETVVEK